MQVVEMENKLEERIKTLEKEKGVFLEEIGQIKEVAELSEKAKNLEDGVKKPKEEVRTLGNKIPQEFLQELSEAAFPLLNEENEEEKKSSEECLSYKEEEFLELPNLNNSMYI